MKITLIVLAAMLCASFGASAQTVGDLSSSTLPDHAVWLDTLDLAEMTVGYGTPSATKSINGNPITVAGTVFQHGVGTHAASLFKVDLHGSAVRFVSAVGVDDETNKAGSVTFSVLVDGKPAATTGVLHGGDQPQVLSVDLTGAKTLALVVGDGGDGINYDHADWAGARIIMADNATMLPQAFSTPVDPPRMVIPAADPHAAIHGPRIVGSTPGRPFLFLIPATGDGPLVYRATGLPPGLLLNASTGIITGSLSHAGRMTVHLIVRGPHSVARRDLTIVGGDHCLAQTPQMGWNSWNVWATSVDDSKVRAAVDEMGDGGLAQHGFAYINIDDGWEQGRDAQGNIVPNSKFPDMKATSDYVHSRGLKFGIYSSPGPTTCGGYTATYQHEDQDAASYAGWGVDYLKYDWCSYSNVLPPTTLANLQKPYMDIRKSLDKVNRDILLSLCQYGMGDVWKWGASPGIYGNSWRTTGDDEDQWSSIHEIYESQIGHSEYAAPGHWNDPDMLMVGVVGKGNTHPSHLTPNEQITHISMWCMLSAPLLIGCDMTRVDKFTLALLTNDEALDIDQDPLGHQADCVSKQGNDAEVWSRPLFDGTHAVALVNGSDDPQTISARWPDIGASGTQNVRDLWMHQSLGGFADSYSVSVPAHATVLLKVGTPKTGS